MSGLTANRSNPILISADTSPQSSRRWVPIVLLSLASLINYLDRGSLSVALPFVGRDMHLDPLQQGWALAAFSITYTLAQLPAGWVVDPDSLTVVLKPVEVLRFDPGTVVLSGGLDGGEIVVTAGVQALHPGQKVRPLGVRS